MEILIRILLMLFALFAMTVVFALPIYLVFFGGMEKFAVKPLWRCYDGIEVHEFDHPGIVSFQYHTYRGLLLWSTQDVHEVHAPYDDARELLWRLLRFNLTWGMLSHGFVLVPLVAIPSYRKQLRLIRQQNEAGGQDRRKN